MNTLYSIWIAFLFGITFFCILPLYYVFLQNEKWHHLAHKLTKFWAWVIMTFARIKVETEWKSKPYETQPCVYVANHFSYFDIPILAYTVPGHYKFMGKQSLGEIPLFGYMFRNLYISVKRESKRESYKAMQKGLETLEKKIGLVLFPEGGIREIAPVLSRFKDGAFRMAIEKQVPIIPITIPHNHIFMPDGTFIVKPTKLKVIFHEAIDTKGLTEEDVKSLKDKVREIIHDELKKANC